MRIASIDDIDAMVEIKTKSLPNDPVTLLGKSFLVKNLYPWLLSNSKLALVCEGDNNEIHGFVIFGDEITIFSIVKHIRFKNFFEIYKRIFSQFFNFNLLSSLIILTLFRPRLKSSIELQWIAVQPQNRCKGIGKKMVSKGIEELTRRGNTNIFTKTLISTPQNIKFYESLGFYQIKTVAGRVFLTKDLQSD